MSKLQENNLVVKMNKPVDNFIENPFFNKSFLSMTMIACTLFIIWRMLDQIGWRSSFPELFSSFDIVPVIFLVIISLIVIFGLVIALPAFIIKEYPVKFNANLFDSKNKRINKLIGKNAFLIFMIDLFCLLLYPIIIYKKINIFLLILINFSLIICVFFILIGIKNIFLKNKFLCNLRNVGCLFFWYGVTLFSINTLIRIYIFAQLTKQISYQSFFIDLGAILIYIFIAKTIFYIILKNRNFWYIKIVHAMIACIVFSAIFLGFLFPRGGDQLINQAFIAIGARSWQVETFIIHEPNFNDRFFY
ncbi:hypothetical protein [Neisseria sp. Ec49-e6-T10]|uniref:hypothetical protein n=1 Tax=Neisseria sp. Ec49-e6-T10 TaxID=3140744 RepID=UPI003EB8DBDA